MHGHRRQSRRCRLRQFHDHFSFVTFRTVAIVAKPAYAAAVVSSPAARLLPVTALAASRVVSLAGRRALSVYRAASHTVHDAPDPRSLAPRTLAHDPWLFLLWLLVRRLLTPKSFVPEQVFHWRCQLRYLRHRLFEGKNHRVPLRQRQAFASPARTAVHALPPALTASTPLEKPLYSQAQTAQTQRQQVNLRQLSSLWRQLLQRLREKSPRFQL